MSLCGRRKKSCRNCGHRFTKAEYDLWTCPECGTDRHCEQPVPRKGDACRFHGGKSKKGIAAPNYQGKGYSKYLPKNVLEDFEDFRNDPEVVNVEAELALARTFLAEKIGSGSSAEKWKEAQRIYSAMLEGRSDPKKFAIAFNELGKILTDGTKAERNDEQIGKYFETVRRLADTQRQIYVDKGELVQRSYFLAIIDMFLEGLSDYVTPLPGGPEAVSRMADLIGSILGRRNASANALDVGDER